MLYLGHIYLALIESAPLTFKSTLWCFWPLLKASISNSTGNSLFICCWLLIGMYLLWTSRSCIGDPQWYKQSHCRYPREQCNTLSSFLACLPGSSGSRRTFKHTGTILVFMISTLLYFPWLWFTFFPLFKCILNINIVVNKFSFPPELTINNNK